jgi:uncharacterized protein YdaU (DUF1376 family)
MKVRTLKTVIITFIAAFILVAAPQNTFAQSAKQKEKIYAKQYKERKKDLEQGGWQVSGTARTIDVALLEYFERLKSNEHNYEIVGEVSACKSINVCKQAAFNNAVTEYANRAGSSVKGRITSDLNLDQSSGKGEFDKLYAAYERLVQTEVKGILQQGFSIVKEKSDGTREYKTFFIINEDAASKARIRAIENAMKETNIAQEYANKISEFVREGFEE